MVPSIRSREVAGAQRSGVRHCEDALKALDFGNGLLGVHSVSISNIRVAMVKPSGICMSCVLARHRSLLRNSTLRDEINRKPPQPMTAFVLVARLRRQPRTLVLLSRRHDHR